MLAVLLFSLKLKKEKQSISLPRLCLPSYSVLSILPKTAAPTKTCIQLLSSLVLKRILNVAMSSYCCYPYKNVSFFSTLYKICTILN